jgi:beta-mannanase/outer membrane protein OmpA-like peptidoglycan-associated protein
MKSLKIARVALGTGAILLGLAVIPASVAAASTTVIVPTQVTSQTPITAGSSRSECLTPNFDNNGPTALSTAVNSFNTLTNTTVTCVGAYIDSATAWSDWELPWVTQSQYGYTSWVAAAPQTHQLVLAADLIPSSLEDISDPLGWEESCDAGNFDQYATTLGDNLVAAGLQNSVIRLGAEMNGVWEVDFIGTTTQEQNDWAQCFANEVTALRAAPGENFLIDWDANAGKGQYPYANYYPGNSYVDILGLDLYDVDSTTPNTSVSFSTLANETYGLNAFEQFAAAQGKPMSFPEWGLSTIPSGDDPAYINGMASAVADNNFAFETYFDGSSNPNSKAEGLSSNTPQSLVAYQDWFGPPTSISGVVTVAGGGDLAGVCAEAFHNGTEVASATSAANGTYTIAGIAPGSYDLEFSPGSCGAGNYAPQWYNDTATGTPISSDALAVSPSVATPSAGIDAAMAVGATISGTATAAVGGSDVGGVCISITSTDGGSGGSATTVGNGTYSVSRFAAGSYTVAADPTCGGTVTTSYASPQPTSGTVTVSAGGSGTYSPSLVLTGSITDVITPSSSAPTGATVGGSTYSPGATATSGDTVQITLDGTSTGCALNGGVVSFTAVGACVIDFNDPATGSNDAYTSAAQVQQSFSVAASSGGGGGGGGGGGSPPSPPVTPPVAPPVTPPVTPPVVPPITVASIPTPREVTYSGDSTALSPKAKDVLSALVKRLARGGSITIVGYALDDPTLARERADVVAKFLAHLLSVHVTIKIVTTSSVAKVMVVTTKV